SASIPRTAYSVVPVFAIYLLDTHRPDIVKRLPPPLPRDARLRPMVMYLDEPAVRAVLRWDQLIAEMEVALTKLSRGRVIQPVRNVIPMEEAKRSLAVIPAVAEDAMGLKAVSFYPGNAGVRPTHLAMILLFNPDTGEPLAVMDGRLITEMRTAAVSAAGTRHLSPPHTPGVANPGSGGRARPPPAE